MNETLLDLKKLHKSVSDILGGGENVVSLWFETMLHYSLVDTVSGQYHNFGEVGATAQMMLANSRKVKLTMEEAKKSAKPHQFISPFLGCTGRS